MTALEAKQKFTFLIFRSVQRKNELLNYVQCGICLQNPLTVKLYANGRRPQITSEEGTQFRGHIVIDHMKTKYHIECVKAWRLKVKEGTDDKATNLVRMCSKLNEKLANKVGSYAVTIYNDAKRLTLSAFSWPSRQISSAIGSEFNINDPDQNATNVRNLDLQYLTPAFHSEILMCIVTVESHFIQQKIKNCLALSLRVDGSVDRTNIDKIYVLAKLINEVGDLESIFIGVGQQTKRKAEGLHLAVKDTIESVSPGFYEICLKKMSSFVTDGAEINKGDKNGLWKRIDDDAAAVGASQSILKIWCAAHRSDLIMKDLSKGIPEIPTILRMLSSIASYFNRSPMRFSELKNLSNEHDVKLVSLPTVYDVRWCENKEQLIGAILVSWKCLVLYFDENVDDEGKCYRKFLTSHKNLILIAFLADLLLVFKMLQKKLQSDDLNPVSLQQHLVTFKKTISDIKVEQLIGGWEDRLSNEIISEIRTSVCGAVTQHKIWHGVELDVSEVEKRGTARIVRDFDAVKQQILNDTTKLTAERFASDEKIVDVLGPFVKLDPSTDIRRVHELIGSDLELVLLNMQFKELCQSSHLKKLNIYQLISHLAKSEVEFETVLIAYARVAAATPHSADVERSISSNNLIKTNLRSSLDLQTENRYLFIHFNLPSLVNWNPRKAVIHWINKKNRREHNVTIDNHKRKATQQRHFKGIFVQNKENNHNSFDDIESEVSIVDEANELNELDEINETPSAKRQRLI